MRSTRMFLLLCPLLWPGLCASASQQDDGRPLPIAPGTGSGFSQPVEKEHASARIWISPNRIPAGGTAYVAMEVTIDPHWHIYWLYSGASGEPTDITVTAPTGVTVGSVIFPRPSRFQELEGIVYGYEDKAIFLVPVTVDEAHEPGTISISVDAFWLVCRKVCLLGDATKELTLEVLPRGVEAPSPDPQIQAAREHQATDFAKAQGFDLSFDGNVLRLTGPLGGFMKADFFPDPMPGIKYGAPTIFVQFSHAINQGRFRIDVPIDINMRNALGDPLELRGLVLIGDKPTDPSYALSVPIPTQEGKETNR